MAPPICSCISLALSEKSRRTAYEKFYWAHHVFLLLVPLTYWHSWHVWQYSYIGARASQPCIPAGCRLDPNPSASERLTAPDSQSSQAQRSAQRCLSRVPYVRTYIRTNSLEPCRAVAGVALWLYNKCLTIIRCRSAVTVESSQVVGGGVTYLSLRREDGAPIRHRAGQVRPRLAPWRTARGGTALHGTTLCAH